MTPEQRFLNLINITSNRDECWEWKASLVTKGYGSFKYKGKTTRAHRFSYLMFNGDLEAGKVIMHTCDNRKCVNPNHLKQGTVGDNNKDCASKGRHHEQQKKLEGSKFREDI